MKLCVLVLLLQLCVLSSCQDMDYDDLEDMFTGETSPGLRCTEPSCGGDCGRGPESSSSGSGSSSGMSGSGSGSSGMSGSGSGYGSGSGGLTPKEGTIQILIN